MKFFLFCCFLTGIVHAQTDSVLLKSCSQTGFRSYLPVVHKEQVVHHVYYSLAYSEPHEQALWVCYVLDSAHCSGGEERRSQFRPDPLVKTGSARNADYAKSGYDRGHLAPAGDMGFSPVAMRESFYYSNISPQLPAFNRGIWKALETQVRQWAESHNSLLVITGPVFQGKYFTIGKNEVAVPSSYYKILIDPQTAQAIGFVLPNAASDRPLSEFAVTIDEIEQQTRIDFLPALPDTTEDKLESQVNSSYWFSTSN